MNDEKITIRLKLNSAAVRLVIVAVVLLAGLTGSVVWARDRAEPSMAPLLQDGTGRYSYLTATEVDGAEALTACASGYHMAALWEILDTSNLVYETTLGLAVFDSGEGPPTGSDQDGWIRTGNTASIGPTTPGQHNCAAWTHDIADTWGTVAYLPNDWTTPDSTVGVWAAASAECNTTQRVWCVKD